MDIKRADLCKFVHLQMERKVHPQLEAYQCVVGCAGTISALRDLTNSATWPIIAGSCCVFHNDAADDYSIRHFRHLRSILRCRHSKPDSDRNGEDLPQSVAIVLYVFDVAQLRPCNARQRDIGSWSPT